MRIGVMGPVAMSGGVALNGGVVSAVSKELRCPIQTHKDAQLAGAYGAALLGWERLVAKRSQ